jgi:broad specificity phosphatase PhoE
VLILLRHASTDWNAKKAGGETEFVRGNNSQIGINAQGRDEALQAAKKICQYPVKEIHRGTYKRDVDTAHIVAQYCQIPEVEDVALNPWNTGDLTGKPYSLIWPLMALLIDIPGMPVPGGESSGEHRARWDAAFWKAYAEYGHRSDIAVVLVTHGTEFRALRSTLYGEPVNTAKRENVKPAEIVVIE